MLLLQVESKKKGEPARPAAGPTKEEFINFLKRAQAAFQSRLEDPSNRANWESILGMDKGPAQAPYPKSRPFRPIWSWDRPRIHGSVGGKNTAYVLEQAGLSKEEHFDLPPKSGRDLHRVIERVHARLVSAFERWFASDLQPYSVQTYKDVLQTMFYCDASIASPGVIQAEVRALPAVMAAICGLAGDYPPHPYH